MLYKHLKFILHFIQDIITNFKIFNNILSILGIVLL